MSCLPSQGLELFTVQFIWLLCDFSSLIISRKVLIFADNQALFHFSMILMFSYAFYRVSEGKPPPLFKISLITSGEKGGGGANRSK